MVANRQANKQALLAIWAFALVTAAMSISPLSRMLVYGLPLMAFFTATYIAKRSVRLYMSFLVSLWILAPLVRRLVDYHVGWIPATLILLAPHMATVAPLLTLKSRRANLMHSRFIPFAVVLLTTVYGTVVGFLQNSGGAVVQDLALWLLPICIVPLLFAYRDELPEILQGLESAFVWGLIIMGAYGVLQFFLLPKWDVLWMVRENLESIGPPLPLKVRVFSTMNSPQVLASYLSCGLLFTLASRHRLRAIAIPLGLLALLLSAARSGWLAFIVGLGYLFFFLTSRQRTALLAFAVLSFFAFILAFQDPNINKILSARFKTFTDISQDASYMDRTEGYQAFFESLIDHPYGMGVGASAMQQKDLTASLGRGGKTVYTQDSTVAWVMASFGIVGSAVLCVAMGMLLTAAYRGSLPSRSGLQPVRAALLGLLAEAVLMGILVGPTGFLTWLCIGLLVANEAFVMDEEHLRLPPTFTHALSIEAL